ncbi:hypothetical protein SAY87_005808 [Trapa incisa]|uniref:Uncharacterized protein n=1 Tax=Trapa incisa TaxID=236973 RepID=A0AAN7KD41_9MYRT|nr:hypothetical protein SAY87_005808 [Trapa incisa]
MRNLSVSLLGLQNHINIARNILEESESHLVDAASVMQNANETFLANEVVDCHDVLPGQSVINNKCEDILLQNSNLNPEHTDYAAMMAVIYNMMKQDFLMQERIVSALNLKLSSGELESYCLMWSLRPFINDDIMHEAWKLIR